jgi:phosphoribosylglycinamide formyltransferase-1
MGTLHLGVLASGRGSNLQSIVDASEKGELDAAVKVVISNNSKAYALERARNHGIPAVHLSHKQFETAEAFDRAFLETLSQYEVELIVLAGYMKLISSRIVQAYRNRILNIHPALLPSFGGKGMYGIHVHEAVIETGAKISGVTVHIVDEQYDHGPIVLQKAVPVLDEDTPESLAARILPEEHRAYPEAIQLFAQKRIRVEGRRVFTTEGTG